MKTPQELAIERRKQLVAAQQIWIDHPQTQLFIQWLEDREKRYKNDLTAGILVSSNKEQEDNYRACIRTIKAVIVMIKNPETFLAQIQKHNHPTENETEQNIA